MADTEQQAMTSARLAELTRKHDAAIDALWESAEDVYRDDYMDARSLWFELLAEVERLRAAQRELAEKLDAETDYSAGRIESLLKRCAGLRHRAHMAEQQREQAMTVVRAVADTGADFDMNTGNSWLLFPGLYAAEQCREQARALMASAGDGEQAQGEA